MSAQEKVKTVLVKLGGRAKLSQIVHQMQEEQLLEEDSQMSNVFVRLQALKKWGEVFKNGNNEWCLVQSREEAFAAALVLKIEAMKKPKQQEEEEPKNPSTFYYNRGLEDALEIIQNFKMEEEIIQ